MYHRSADRDDTITPERLQNFLDIWQECCNQRQAAKKASISLSSIHNWRKKDKDFNTAWGEAHAVVCDNLEAEAVRRGMEGVKKPIMHGGKQVGTVREHSDDLLKTLLAANMPDKFGKQRIEHSGAMMMVETKVSLVKRRPGDDAKVIGEENVDPGSDRERDPPRAPALVPRQPPSD